MYNGTKHIAFIVTVFVSTWIYGQTAIIPDANFLNFIKNQYPSTINAQDELILAEAANVTGTFYCYSKGVSNAEGIQYFTGIDGIYLANNNLTSLPDLSAITGLKVLHVNDNQLTSLPVLSSNTALEFIIAQNNALTSLPNLSNNTNLQELIVYNNNLSSLPLLNSLIALQKLEIGGNNLTAIPEISNLTQLRVLKAWKNQLTALPNLTTLTNLRTLSLDYNQLTIGPDLTGNTNLERVELDHNLLTTGPDLDGVTGLYDVELDYNYLSFEDILPYYYRPDFDNDFDVTPQLTFEVGYEVQVMIGDTVKISTGIDANISNLTYDWYLNGIFFYRTFDDELTINNIQESHAGTITCTISSTEVTRLVLSTNEFNITVMPCIDISNLDYTVTPVSCTQTGKIEIDINTLPSDDYLFVLKGKSSNKEMFSENGVFQGLTEEKYTLEIISNKACIENYSSAITLQRLDCKDILLTPNGDGIQDEYFFENTGEIILFNKNGMEISRLQGPVLWNGKVDNSVLPNGYYIAYLKEQDQHLSITILR